MYMLQLYENFQVIKKANSIQVNTDLTRIFSFSTQVVNFK